LLQTIDFLAYFDHLWLAQVGFSPALFLSFGKRYAKSGSPAIGGKPHLRLAFKPIEG
jgi:hypothetical protein